MTNMLNYLKVQKIDIAKVYCTVIDWPVISTDTFCSWRKDTASRRRRKWWVTLSLSALSVWKPSRKPRATSSLSKASLQSRFLVLTFPSTRAIFGPVWCLSVLVSIFPLLCPQKSLNVISTDLPKKINAVQLNPDMLVSKYIPNLVAKTFEVSRNYAQLIYNQTSSPRLDKVLKKWDQDNWAAPE